MNPVLEARMHLKNKNSSVSTKIVLADDKMHIGRSQDCTPIAERAYAMHKEGFHGSSDMKLAATIPMVIVEKYCNEHGVSFAEFMSNQEHMKRIVNDPDNKMFRIWHGAI